MINIYDLYLIATNGLCPYGIVCKNAVFIKHALALPLPEDEHYDIHVTWYIFFFSFSFVSFPCIEHHEELFLPVKNHN